MPEQTDTHTQNGFYKKEQRGRKITSICVLLASARIHTNNEETLCFQNKSGFSAELIMKLSFGPFFLVRSKYLLAGLEIGH